MDKVKKEPPYTSIEWLFIAVLSNCTTLPVLSNGWTLCELPRRASGHAHNHGQLNYFILSFHLLVKFFLTGSIPILPHLATHCHQLRFHKSTPLPTFWYLTVHNCLSNSLYSLHSHFYPDSRAILP